MSRISSNDLDLLTRKKGYAIQSQIGGGIKSSFNSKAESNGPTPNVEQHSGPQPLGPQRATLRYSGQVLIRIQFFRRRLADPDGNSPKYYLDALRYAGALEDDTERHVRIITEPQQKVATNEEERVEITLEYEDVDFSNLWNE